MADRGRGVRADHDAGDDVTVAGRLDQAAELVRLGTVTPEDYLRVVGVDDGASPSVDAYWAGTLRDLKK